MPYGEVSHIMIVYEPYGLFLLESLYYKPNGPVKQFLTSFLHPVLELLPELHYNFSQRRQMPRKADLKSLFSAFATVSCGISKPGWWHATEISAIFSLEKTTCKGAEK
jgi:hypothetical protein